MQSCVQVPWTAAACTSRAVCRLSFDNNEVSTHPTAAQCRSWHEVLSQPQFQQACRINIGLFVDKLDRLARHLHRVSNR